MNDIKDEHLLNILNLLYRGGGHKDFICEEVAENLYIEAIKRGLNLKYKLTDILESVRNETEYHEQYLYYDV